jgi:hypothetical protein
MTLFDYTMRAFVPSLGFGTKWLKEQLDAAAVKVHLTDGCVEELANDAEGAAWRASSSANGEPMTYLERLRSELAARAEFVRRWTASDDKFDMTEESNQALVRIARKYALPRPWKVSEPVASEWRRPPLAWRWPTGGVASPVMPQAMPQT